MKAKQSLTLRSSQLSQGHTHTHTHTHTEQAVIINAANARLECASVGKPRAERRLETIRMTSLRRQVWELRAYRLGRSRSGWQEFWAKKSSLAKTERQDLWSPGGARREGEGPAPSVAGAQGASRGAVSPRGACAQSGSWRANTPHKTSLQAERTVWGESGGHRWGPPCPEGRSSGGGVSGHPGEPPYWGCVTCCS